MNDIDDKALVLAAGLSGILAIYFWFRSSIHFALMYWNRKPGTSLSSLTIFRPDELTEAALVHRAKCLRAYVGLVVSVALGFLFATLADYLSP
jgi:hypothetical protein